MATNFSYEYLSLTDSATDYYYTTCLQRQRHLAQNKLPAIAISVLNVLLCLIALGGNSAILIAICKTRSLHLPAYILLASLAASDFGVGLIAQPVFTAFLLLGVHGFSPSYVFLCNYFVNITSSFLCTISFLNVTAIGLDRLLALQLHLRYTSVVNSSRAKVVAISIWSCGAFSTIFWHWESFMQLTLIPGLIAFILLSNFVIYLKIYFIVRRHQIQICQIQPQVNNGNILSRIRLKNSAANTFQVYILMVCCFIPYVMLKLIGNYTFTAYYTTSTVIFLNSSLNPFVYYWRLREVRFAVKRLLRR